MNINNYTDKYILLLNWNINQPSLLLTDASLREPSIIIYDVYDYIEQCSSKRATFIFIIIPSIFIPWSENTLSLVWRENIMMRYN